MPSLTTGEILLVGVTLALLIGAATRHLLRHSRTPYTATLLLIGLVVALLQRSGATGPANHFLGGAFALLAQVDPHLILLVFLPTLIFEAAFSTEVHLFRRTLAQIATLAMPVFLVCVAGTALLTKYLFPWGWSWAVALMFGSLICATDPVAVVALLKEVSSRKRLETLIEGESLLNDAVSLVLFTFFYAYVTSQAAVIVPTYSLVGEFFWIFCAGALVGVGVAWLALRWIETIVNDPFVEITLSIAVAYLVYYVADNVLHVSGVVAVVTAALLFASRGRTRISPPVFGFLSEFWEVMAYMANTLIFLMVGVIIASRIRLDSLEMWGALALLYVALLAVRALAVILFSPLLQRTGIGMSRRKAIVLTWGGSLRGAVALAMALSVAQNEAVPQAIRDQVLFLTAGIVALTIIINGSTLRAVLRWLKLDELPFAKTATVKKAQDLVEHHLDQVVDRLKQRDELQHVQWDRVEADVKLRIPYSAEALAAMRGAADHRELEVAYRRRILETERQSYWTQFSSGAIANVATHILVNAVESVLDAEPRIGPRPQLRRYLQLPAIVRTLGRIPLLKYLVRRMQWRYLVMHFDVAWGFRRAQHDIEKHLEALAPRAHMVEAVRQEIALNREAVNAWMATLGRLFPKLVQQLENQKARSILLSVERKEVQDLLHSAALAKPEAIHLTQMIEAKMARNKVNPH